MYWFNVFDATKAVRRAVSRGIGIVDMEPGSDEGDGTVIEGMRIADWLLHWQAYEDWIDWELSDNSEDSDDSQDSEDLEDEGDEEDDEGDGMVDWAEL